MGIYDRSYYREDESGNLLSGRSVVFWLIVANVVVLFLLSFLEQYRLDRYLELDVDLMHSPLQWYRLVTYGFAHVQLWHILWNMLGLYFFGKPIEEIYGPREFLRIYMMLLVMSGLVFVVAELAIGGHGRCIGASGAVAGTLILFVMHYPQQIIYFFGVFPMRAWVMGAIFLAVDLMGAMSANPADRTAYTAHLGGALFGFIYYRTGWNLGKMIPSRWPRMKRPKLKIHDPEAEERQLARQVDAILEKISRDGEASLTKQERRILAQASRRYQRRRG